MKKVSFTYYKSAGIEIRVSRAILVLGSDGLTILIYSDFKLHYIVNIKILELCKNLALVCKIIFSAFPTFGSLNIVAFNYLKRLNDVVLNGNLYLYTIVRFGCIPRVSIIILTFSGTAYSLIAASCKAYYAECCDCTYC